MDKQVGIKMSKITIDMDAEGLNEFVDLLMNYIESQGLRHTVHEFKFIQNIFSQLGFRYKFNAIFTTAKNRRKERVDYYLKNCTEQCGDEILRLPKNYEQFRHFLEEWDTSWSSSDGYLDILNKE